MWKDYAVPGGTYRENLLRTPGEPHAPVGHPSTQFRYDVLKEKYADEKGNIVINREDSEPIVEEKTAPSVEAPAAVTEEKVVVSEAPVVEEKTPVVEEKASIVEETKIPEPAAQPVVEEKTAPAVAEEPIPAPIAV